MSPAIGFLFAHLPHQPQWEARLWRSVKVSKQQVRHLTLLLLTQASNLLHNLLQLFARREPLLSGSSQRPASCLLFLTQVSNLLHNLPQLFARREPLFSGSSQRPASSSPCPCSFPLQPVPRRCRSVKLWVSSEELI